MMKKSINFKRFSVICLFFLIIILINKTLEFTKKKSIYTPSRDGNTLKVENTNKILYDIIDKYRIISMLDLGCNIFGSSLLKNLSIEFNRKFTYHGVCNNDTLIKILQNQYENERNFSKFDFVKEKLPPKYELIFLDYTPANHTLNDVIMMLYSFANTKNSVYFLVSSRITNEPIDSILNEEGIILNLDLTKMPFNLTNYVQIDSEYEKYLLLYELSEMRKINFKKMKTESELFINGSKEKSFISFKGSTNTN